jgi:hypothetical protein
VLNHEQLESVQRVSRPGPQSGTSQIYKSGDLQHLATCWVTTSLLTPFSLSQRSSNGLKYVKNKDNKYLIKRNLDPT